MGGVDAGHVDVVEQVSKVIMTWEENDTGFDYVSPKAIIMYILIIVS